MLQSNQLDLKGEVATTKPDRLNRSSLKWSDSRYIGAIISSWEPDLKYSGLAGCLLDKFNNTILNFTGSGPARTAADVIPIAALKLMHDIIPESEKLTLFVIGKDMLRSLHTLAPNWELEAQAKKRDPYKLAYQHLSKFHQAELFDFVQWDDEEPFKFTDKALRSLAKTERLNTREVSLMWSTTDDGTLPVWGYNQINYGKA
jgi:hypothetical protein